MVGVVGALVTGDAAPAALTPGLSIGEVAAPPPPTVASPVLTLSLLALAQETKER